MSFIRGLGVDLVDKRLWPLALVLVAALLAIPLLLTKKSHTTPVAATPAAAVAGATVQTGPSGDTTQIKDVTLSGGLAGRVRGPSKNPFKQQHQPQAQTATVAGAGSGASSSGSGGGASAGTQAVPTGPEGKSGSTTTTTSTTTTVIRKQYVALLRFNQIGKKATLRAFRPGTAMPSNADPLVVYLGKLKKSTSVAFLVSGDVVPNGEGRCANNHVVCDAVLLAPGDIEYFDRPLPNGRHVRYRLQFVKTYLG